MPWRTTGVWEQRLQLVLAYGNGEASVAELARRAGVSRKTAYKFLERYAKHGVDGLRDRSRAPHDHPQAVPEEIRNALLQMRNAHPTWGPRKLIASLRRQDPTRSLPARSTVSRLLRAAGLAARRRRRRHAIPLTTPFGAVGVPNDLWCADFKGWFLARNGERCEPLTITDAVSRYALACQVLSRISTDRSRPIFERTFREYGLPRALRTDNGNPFAGCGLGGLTRLSAWWVRLGIRPDRIAPGKPQQNGRHERFHLTLQQATARPPAVTRVAQQRASDTFIREYNDERPHAALNDRTPADLYTPSPRPYPRRLRAPEYPACWMVRSIRSRGTMKWKGDFVFVSEALVGQRVGLCPMADGVWGLYFGPLELARYDERLARLIPLVPAIWHDQDWNA